MICVLFILEFVMLLTSKLGTQLASNKYLLEIECATLILCAWHGAKQFMYIIARHPHVHLMILGLLLALLYCEGNQGWESLNKVGQTAARISTLVCLTQKLYKFI